MREGWRDDLAAAVGGHLQPAPPPASSARGRRGPPRVELPIESFPRAGAIAFDYSGTGIVDSSVTWAPLSGFTVPEQLEGLVIGLAAGSLTPADNDELAIELFVNGASATGDLVLNVGAPLLTIPAISADLTEPSPVYILLRPGDVVNLAGRLSGLSLLTPTGATTRPVRGRMVGRFWPKLLGQSEV